MATFIVQMSDYIHAKPKGCWTISQFAKECRFAFSKHEVLGSKIIGLDRIKRKLLFFTHSRHRSSCCIIDLADVQTCTIRKIYSGIEAGELRRRTLEEYLHTMALHMRFKNGRNEIALPFYETKANAVYEIPELEAKANDWRVALSRMLPGALKERA